MIYGKFIEEVSLDDITNGIDIPSFSFVFLRMVNISETSTISITDSVTPMSLTTDNQTKTTTWNEFILFAIMTMIITRKTKKFG